VKTASRHQRLWLIPLVIGLLLLAGCGPGDDALGMSGTNPVALAAAYGRTTVAYHNASNPGPKWMFVRAYETGVITSVAAGSTERDFVILAALPAGATRGPATGVATVGLVKRRGSNLWKAVRSVGSDPW